MGFSNEDSFYNAFTELIKRIVNKEDDKINTRLKKEDLEEVLAEKERKKLQELKQLLEMKIQT